MARVSTEKVVLHGSERNEFKMSYEVNVSVDGEFTTTIPADFVELFQKAQINLRSNGRRGAREGFFSDKTMEGLKKQVLKVCEDYMSRELESEVIIIRYNIETVCSYCINDANEIVPNGGWVEDYGGRHNWHQGTKEIHAATRGKGYGMRIYVELANKQTFKYKSGLRKIEYEQYTANDRYDEQLGDNAKWLAGLCSWEPFGELKEIEYNENIAAFFVKFIKMICQFNEQIIEYLNPEGIKELAESIKFKLLNDGK